MNYSETRCQELAIERWRIRSSEVCLAESLLPFVPGEDIS
jgi:hypothetical protein